MVNNWTLIWNFKKLMLFYNSTLMKYIYVILFNFNSKLFIVKKRILKEMFNCNLKK